MHQAYHSADNMQMCLWFLAAAIFPWNTYSWRADVLLWLHILSSPLDTVLTIIQGREVGSVRWLFRAENEGEMPLPGIAFTAA
jgi:hypothetical protein